MRAYQKLAVVVMCMAWLASLFGCSKGHLADGPGMERGVWSEFTLSRCSEFFEPIYSYTVRYDEALDEGYLCTGQTEIRLDQETIAGLYNLDLMSLPDAEALDGTFLGLAVTDRNGQVYAKQISSAKEEEILALLNPYLDALNTDGGEEPFMLDGPDMEYSPPWRAFVISRSDSNAQYNFWFAVTDADLETLVTGECIDEEGRSYAEQTGIPVLAETLQALQWMNLEQLPDEAEWPEDLERQLDDSSITLAVTLSDGTIVKKNASSELSIEIYQLLLPYFKNQ